MIVAIWLKETSQAIVIPEASNTYQKGDFFCVYVSKDNQVTKYPIANIWRVIETYTTDKQEISGTWAFAFTGGR